MASIVSYQKSITRLTTIMLNAPEGSTELCTIDGTTYVSIPDGEAIDMDQHEHVLKTLDSPALDAEMIDKICNASPHVALIRERVRAMIEDHYSICDEIKLLRTAPSPEFEAYNEHAEHCRQWGREQKALLGLEL